jgi:hypothetical protein
MTRPQDLFQLFSFFSFVANILTFDIDDDDDDAKKKSETTIHTSFTAAYAI